MVATPLVAHQKKYSSVSGGMCVAPVRGDLCNQPATMSMYVDFFITNNLLPLLVALCQGVVS